MRRRAAQMARIVSVRALRERVDEVARARAAAKVRLVEEDLRRACGARVAAVEGSSQALLEGDRGEWMLADAMREVAAWQIRRLEEERIERVAAADDAARVLQISQRQREQAEAMLKRNAEAVRQAEQRQAQAQSDDRFLARRQWKVGPRAYGALMDGHKSA